MSPSLKSGLLIGACGALLGSSGCRLSLLDGNSGPPVRYYELPAATVKAAPSDSWCRDLVLLLGDFQAAAKYDGRLFVALPAHRVQAVSSRRWILPPEQLLVGVLHEACLQSRLFRHVLRSRTAARPDLRLTGGVLLFEQRRDSSGRNTAVLKLTVLLARENGAGSGRTLPAAEPEVLWTRTLEREQPLTADSAEAFVAAMGRNVDGAVARILEEIAALRPDSQ